MTVAAFTGVAAAAAPASVVLPATSAGDATSDGGSGGATDSGASSSPSPFATSVSDVGEPWHEGWRRRHRRAVRQRKV
jgi:hypothetical protein